MKSIERSARRGLAAGLVGALALSTAAVVGTSAHAEVVAPAPALSWNISEQAFKHLGVKTATEGASVDETAKTLNFPLESVTQTAAGTVVADYEGHVNAAFGFGGKTYYSVNIEDPRLVVEADGDGRLEATVNSVGTHSDPTVATDPQRVVVAEFDGAVNASGVVTATPDFVGVLPHGSAEAIELGVSKPATEATAEDPAKAATPVDGASFHPEFLSALHPDVRGTFYRSNASSDALKAPGTVVADLGEVPAPAAEGLNWNLSEQAFKHLGVKTPTDGATVDADAKNLNFPVVAATVDRDGERITQFGGAVNAAFGFGGKTYYSVNIVRPRLVVEADGDGRLEATVNSVGTHSDPTVETTMERVVVAEFDSSETIDGRTIATPNFEGVLPHGSAEAIELGVSKPATEATAEDPAKAATPVDGASFHPEFLSALHPDVRGTFYRSNASSDALKAPGTIVVEAPAADEITKPTVTVTNSDIDAEYTTFTVKGSGFSHRNVGVYASLVEAGKKIDWTAPRADGTAATLATTYVTPDRFDGNAFTAFVQVDTAALERGAKYEILTAQAHGTVNIASETRTPAVVDWVTLDRKPTTTSVTGNVKTPLAVTLTAKVSPNAAGTVTFKSGSAVVGTAVVKNGVATLKLTGLNAGKRSYTAVFTPANGDAFGASTSRAVTVTVAKATAKTTVKVTKKATRKKAGKVKITVAAGAAKATGKAKVTIKVAGKKKAVVKRPVLRKGVATVVLPKAAKKGTYKVTVTYAGDKNLKAAKKKVSSFKVK